MVICTTFFLGTLQPPTRGLEMTLNRSCWGLKYGALSGAWARRPAGSPGTCCGCIRRFVAPCHYDAWRPTAPVLTAWAWRDPPRGEAIPRRGRRGCPPSVTRPPPRRPRTPRQPEGAPSCIFCSNECNPMSWKIFELLIRLLRLQLRGMKCHTMGTNF